MFSLNKILFPTDYSTCAEHAFSHAAFLAARYKADLHVLHITTSEDPAWDAPAWESSAPLIHATRIHTAPAESILAYAEEEDVDLIVMGTHGRHGVDRLLMGSVAERVVRLSPCPVLTVHPNSPIFEEGLERILVPVDFSEHSRIACLYARELATTYGAHLDLLHVIPDDSLAYVYGMEAIGVEATSLVERAKASLTQLAAELETDTVSVQVHTFIGYPAQDIVEFAERGGDRLVVVATHGRTGLERFFLGSVTEKVVRMATCPVFTVKSFGKQLIDTSAAPTQAHSDA